MLFLSLYRFSTMSILYIKLHAAATEVNNTCTGNEEHRNTIVTACLS
jgi:hypothetical protein